MPSRSSPAARSRVRALGCALALAVACAASARAEDDGGYWERNARPLLIRSEPGPPPTLGLLDYADVVMWRGALDPDEAPFWNPDDLVHAYRWLVAAEPENLADETGRDWHRRLVPDDLRRVVLDVEIASPEGGRQRGRLVLRPGLTARLVRARALSVAATYDAELACDNSGGERPSALGDPQLRALVDGLALDVRAFPLPGEGRVALECLVQEGRFEEPIERVATRARFLGRLDLPRYRGLLGLVSGAASADRPLSFTVESDVGAWTVRLTPRIRAPLEVPFADSPVGRLDIGLLTAPSWRLIPQGLHPQLTATAQVRSLLVWEAPELTSPGGFLERVLPESKVLLRGDGTVWVTATGAPLERARRMLDAWQEARARTVRIEARALIGDEVVARFDATALTGRTAHLRVGRDRAIIPSADVEVG
jgi:hypothetical protein